MAKTYFYPENEPRRGGGVTRYHDLKATEIWLNHYSNQLYLEFFLAAEMDFGQKRETARELQVCRQKLEYWKKHPNWDMAQATAGADRLKKQWQQPGQVAG